MTIFIFLCILLFKSWRSVWEYTTLFYHSTKLYLACTVNFVLDIMNNILYLRSSLNQPIAPELLKKYFKSNLKTFSGAGIELCLFDPQTVSACVIQPMIVNTVSSPSWVNPI